MIRRGLAGVVNRWGGQCSMESIGTQTFQTNCNRVPKCDVTKIPILEYCNFGLNSEKAA